LKIMSSANMNGMRPDFSRPQGWTLDRGEKNSIFYRWTWVRSHLGVNEVCKCSPLGARYHKLVPKFTHMKSKTLCWKRGLRFHSQSFNVCKNLLITFRRCDQ
jgi:hypothetical protein